MPGDHRVTLTRRHAYRTNSNRVKTIRAPGGRYVAKYLKKARTGVICADAGCDIPLPGIKHMSSQEYATCKKREKSVSRAYGGNLCGICLKNRITRAFLIEEVKLAKRAMAEKKDKSKK